LRFCRRPAIGVRKVSGIETRRDGSQSRVLEIDACRGIAALCVAVAHLWLHFDLIYGYDDLSPQAADHPVLVTLASRAPVCFFFLISGYVISLSVDASRSAHRFLLGRIARLYPAYWAAVALTASVIAIAPGLGGEISIEQVASNTLMIQNWFGAANIDPGYWSLAHEAMFYVLMAAAFPLVAQNPKGLARFSAIWLAVSAVAYAVAPDTVAKTPILSQALLYAPFFIGGVGFRLWASGERSAFVAVLIAASLAASATRIPVYGAPVAVGLFATFYAVVFGRAKALAIPPLLILGRISYSLYLTHLAPGYAVILAAEGLGAPSILSFAAGLLAAVFCACLVHSFVEAPGRRAILRLADQAPPVSAARPRRVDLR
jgi:peptidoglycan/LPS O-acetylase OafA/YrhL